MKKEKEKRESKKTDASRGRERKASALASSHQSDRFMTDSSQKTERAACPRRRPPSALFHRESFIRGKITGRGAKRSMVERKEKKKSQPCETKGFCCF